MNNRRLQIELRESGASAAEARELATIADKLRVLKSAQASRTLAHMRNPWIRFLPAASAAVVFLLVGMTMVTFAQSSLPGNWLYPVKRLSENTAVTVDPNYRATLMMRRAEEVRQLVAAKANPQRVSATLAAYSVEAASYKTKDYAAFEYCKANLQLAMASATPAEKQMITGTLDSLRDVD